MAKEHDNTSAIPVAKQFVRKLRKATPRTVMNKLGFYYVRNKNVALRARQSTLYQKLKKQYRDILEAPVEPVCWFQGFDNAPDLVKACLNSLRRNLSGYEIVMLDDTNLHTYVQFPDYIEEKRRKGIIRPAHYSDLVRAALLSQYGGIWFDSTVLCTSPALMSVIESAPLFVFKEYSIYRYDASPTIASSWLIGAVSNHPILLKTRDLLYAYWKREKRLKNYFLFHLFFAMAARQFPQEWDKVPPYNNISPFMMQFEMKQTYTPELWEKMLSFSPIHKLSYRYDYSSEKENLYKHVLREYLPK